MIGAYFTWTAMILSKYNGIHLLVAAAPIILAIGLFILVDRSFTNHFVLHPQFVLLWLALG